MTPHIEQWKRLMHIYGEIDAAYHDAALKMGLSDSAMHILYTVVMAQGTVYPAEIARLSGLSRQTVNSALRGLERQGVLYLEAETGRNRPVRLTQAGETLCRERVAPLVAAEEAVWSGWPEADRRTYLRLSQQYLEDLRAQVEALPDKRDGGEA